uniref:Uncharacterized protein n=1 Tax=Heterorhabditis bacteriophora TaxID=37862 RepID=A0A1I7WTQ0_HETBA
MDIAEKQNLSYVISHTRRPCIGHPAGFCVAQ